MSTSHITVTDQFCGAGGSSQGVENYGKRSGLGSGLEVRLALNHWKLAIETHNTNFPNAIHECTDIQACDPRRYPSTTILVTSPECTNHSVAKGRKQVKAQLDAFDSGKADPAAERSRATMWDVVRFAEHHKYRIVITENVVDARAWVLWDAWLMAMHRLGYEHQVVFYNSMFAWPTPQSRDRMYVVFWRKGQRRPNLDLRPWAPCPQCGPVQAIQKFKPKANVKAKYGTQYVYVCPRCAKQVMPFYYAAINAIDWTVPAERIGERKKPLEERTLARIAYGLKKYGNRPLSVSTLYGERLGCRVKDATESPLFGQHSANATGVVHHRGTEGTGKGPAPFILDSSFTKAKGEYMNSADEPIGTQTKTQSKGVAVPPVIFATAPDRQRQSQRRSRLPQGDGEHWLEDIHRSGASPCPPALMVDTNYFTDHNKGLENPLPTQTGANKLGVAFLAKLRGTDASQVKSTTSGLDEPVGTLSAGGLHHALITGRAMGYLQSYYGTGNQGALDEAMGALSTRDRCALVPFAIRQLPFTSSRRRGPVLPHAEGARGEGGHGLRPGLRGAG